MLAAADDNLVNFLNRAPLGLVHLALDGAIEAINPTVSPANLAQWLTQG